MTRIYPHVILVKKLVIILVFCQLHSSSVKAQVKSGRISYKIVTQKSDSDNGFSPEQNKLFNEFEQNALKLNFELVFNENKSFFAMVKDLIIKDDFKMKMAILLYGGKSAYYVDNNSKLFFEEKEFLGDVFTIRSDFEEIGWNLSNESKIISGYTCYKATGTRYSTNKDFKTSSYNVYAWYCPEIPLNFGPYEAVGLPGLVLEFNAKGYSLVATSLDFNSKPDVRKPKNKKSITKEEFEKIAQKITKQKIGN